MESISQESCNEKTERKEETPIWKGIRENHKVRRDNEKGASGPQTALS